jgi:hypothetical protein
MSLYQKHIDGLKERLKTLDQNIAPADRILQEKAPDILKNVSAQSALDAQLLRQLLEEIIRLQYAQDDQGVNALVDTSGMTNEEVNSLAEGTFEIAKAKENAECLFWLANEYLMDTDLHNEAVLSYAYKQIQVKDYGRAENVLQQHSKKLVRANIKKIGLIFFQKSMTFDKDTKQRNYDIPAKVAEIFNLESAVTTQAATAQFDYNFNHKKFILASEIARQFELPEGKIRKAGVEAFKVKFRKFISRLQEGDYRGKFKLTPDDPYNTSLAVIEKYNLLAGDTKDKEALHFTREIKQFASNLLRRLGHPAEFPDVQMYARVTFVSLIIDDYDLTNSDNQPLRLECLNISRNLLTDIAQNITSLSDALQYHDSLAKLYEANEGLRAEIRRLASKMFDIYCENNRWNGMKDTAETFELADNQAYVALKKKCLDLLEEKDEKTFGKILEWFEKFRLLERFRQDDDFLHKIYFVYQSAIYSNDVDFAARLSDTFKFSRQRRLEPIRARLNEMLNTNRDDEALKVMDLFHVKPSQFMDLFITQYVRRTADNTAEGAIFRNQFGVAVGDVGIWRWFFTEIVPLSFLR